MFISDVLCFKLGGEGCKQVPGCPGFYMRVDDDVRKSVVFFGFEDDSKPGGVRCIGTGFLLSYEESGYLVTARHIAEGIGNDPFVLRINNKSGSVDKLHADNFIWYYHPDDNVDVALIPFHIGTPSNFEVVYLPSEMLAADEHIQNDTIKMLGSFGPGDMTYTVGLFQLLSGKNRNLPLVHSGTIAAIPRDEKIPLTDWRDKEKTIEVEGYLIETQALKGLSGSPVFVRRTLNFSSVPPHFLIDTRTGNPEMLYVAAPQKFLHLLGLWQSSWDYPPDAITAMISGNNVRVPIGMGVVAPAYKITETLQHPELIEMRKKAVALRQSQNAATCD